MQTLVPIGTFEKKARGLLGDEGFEAMLELLARQPRTGKLIQGTGQYGLRKIRIAQPGQGKSGSTRAIYYFHNTQKPILLLLIYAKAKQENLTSRQKTRLKKYVDQIIEEFD